MLVARPTAALAEDGDFGPDAGTDSGLASEVTRLYADAAMVTQRYEAGRREAEAEGTRARRYEELLARERQDIAVLHADLGRIARSQYRSGGGLPLTAQMLFAKNPEELMRGQRAVWQADLAVNNAIGEEPARGGPARRGRGEGRRQSGRKLEKRNSETRRDQADHRGEARRGALDAPGPGGRLGRGRFVQGCGPSRPADRRDSCRTWVTPVETYELSAGFGSGGDRWANGHTGQDFAVPIGTPVRAVGAGRVVTVSAAAPSASRS